MGLKEGISIDEDSGPLGYVLWCCGGICHQPDTFIQVGSGHAVIPYFLFYVIKTWIISSLDEETVQGEETIQGRKLYEEILYVFKCTTHVIGRIEYLLVGDFCVGWNISTVPLVQILQSTVFSRTKNYVTSTNEALTRNFRL